MKNKPRRSGAYFVCGDAGNRTRVQWVSDEKSTRVGRLGFLSLRHKKRSKLPKADLPNPLRGQVAAEALRNSSLILMMPLAPRSSAQR